MRAGSFPYGTSALRKVNAQLTLSYACLVFTGATDRDGYGCVSEAFTNETRRAHVVVWEATYGPVPEGKQVCHTCDNPPCCNLPHLFLSDAAGNQSDKVAKNRHAKGSTVGTAILTEAQVTAIRADHVPRLVPARVLAERYGVAKVTIDRVLQRRSWQHVP